MNNFGDNKYELTSMQQQYNRKVSIIAFVVSICPIFWCPRGGGIWEGVYMTLAVAAYHWFLLHWSENLHPRFQIPNTPSENLFDEYQTTCPRLLEDGNQLSTSWDKFGLAYCT